MRGLGEFVGLLEGAALGASVSAFLKDGEEEAVTVAGKGGGGGGGGGGGLKLPLGDELG